MSIMRLRSICFNVIKPSNMAAWNNSLLRAHGSLRGRRLDWSQIALLIWIIMKEPICERAHTSFKAPTLLRGHQGSPVTAGVRWITQQIGLEKSLRFFFYFLQSDSFPLQWYNTTLLIPEEILLKQNKIMLKINYKLTFVRNIQVSSNWMCCPVFWPFPCDVIGHVMS